MSSTSPRPSAGTDGRRICVYGPSGSGKTTFSRRLGALLGLPVIELDAIFHQPGWQPTPDDEFRAKVRDALARCPDGWVVDGNYRAVKPVLLPLADTVVWLRPRFLPTYWRLLWRTVTRASRKQELWNTNRESFRLSFASRDSILLWGITHWRAHQRNALRNFAEIDHSAHIIQLHNDREVERWLGRVGAVASRPGGE
ncbi:MAG: AAA family ATPase [Dehalococcoidia bacterium]